MAIQVEKLDVQPDDINDHPASAYLSQPLKRPEQQKTFEEKIENVLSGILL